MAASALGELLDTLSWDVYLSAFPRYRATGADRATELFRDRISGLIGSEYGRKPVAAAFAESAPSTDRLHLHATLQVPGGADTPLNGRERRRADLMDRVEREWPGDTEVRPYANSGAAARYAAKDFGQPDSAFWISPKARKALSRQAAKAGNREQIFRDLSRAYSKRLPENRPADLKQAVQQNT